ncbi:MAG: DAK2 domain-containing protein [Frankiaceae bacterium]
MSTDMPAAGSLDGPAVARWLVAGADALGSARGELDDINVFPVADGDTGTNLALTATAVADAVRPWAGASAATTAETVGAGLIAETAAEAALQGARGNSGVILAAWLHGFSDGVSAQPLLDGGTLADGLGAASRGATAAVGRPLEGTILTVARAAAQAARLPPPPATAAQVAASALAGARAALIETTSQLPVLAAAGVVDAGGAGLVVLLEALAGVPRVPADRTAVPSRASDQHPVAEAPTPESEPAYEVMYLLEAPAQSLPTLEATLGALGDSLVVSGRPGYYRVHVHVDDVGAAIEAAIEVGRPRQITVTRFADQVRPAVPAAAAGRAVVALVHGAGLSPLLAAAGATVVEGFQLGWPSTAEVLHAIRGTGAGEVILLPNDASAAVEAEAAAARAREEGRTVRVVPTRSVMQGLAALSVHDPDMPFGDAVVAMTATARSTRSGEVMIAEHAALTSAGICAPGQALGLIEGDVALIADDVGTAAGKLLDRLLLGGGELVTVVIGADAPDGLADRLAAQVRAGWPAVEVELHDCGQVGHPLLVGVE